MARAPQPVAAAEAVQAAVRAGVAAGYAVKSPLLLAETNNVVVWLRPSCVVAKVGRWQHSHERLRREHAVGSELRGIAPIAPPIAGVDPTIDVETGYLVTFWEGAESEPERELSTMAIVPALRQLHAGLARCRTLLPDFRHSLALARTVLADDARMKALANGNRQMLRSAFDHLLAELDSTQFSQQGLHGEPHTGNLLRTRSGLRWIDLESACLGPLEWDLAFLSEDAVAEFPEANPELVSFLRVLNSARVATWCWARVETGDLQWHAEHHLGVVRDHVSGRNMG